MHIDGTVPAPTQSVLRLDFVGQGHQTLLGISRDCHSHIPGMHLLRHISLELKICIGKVWPTLHFCFRCCSRLAIGNSYPASAVRRPATHVAILLTIEGCYMITCGCIPATCTWTAYKTLASRDTHSATNKDLPSPGSK